MQHIIDWLKGMEKLACDLYTGAAVVYQDDTDLLRFLNRLAKDESRHLDFMASASDDQAKHEVPCSAITLDQDMRDRIEGPLRDGYKLVSSGTISKAQILNSIVKAEFSEWNDVFLYVINSLKEHDTRFQYAAATIQAHQKRIERFVDDLPDDLKPPDDIRKLPHIWHNRFLIVDDEKPILQLLASVLGRIGEVETAENGKEALEKTADLFFNVIVTDISMPVMDGFEFYRKATEAHPHLAPHFVFCSGGITLDAQALLDEHHLPYLRKPFRLDEITQAVQKIVRQAL
ncbi:response regulator [Verrucomicrobiota bacterium]